jgi:hypothetical protein
VDCIWLNFTQDSSDFAGHTKGVGHALGFVLWQLDALKAMNHHLHAVMFLNSRPKALVVRPDNHMDLVPISNQATCQALRKTRRAIDVGCKSVAGNHDL